jgi:hypothetical protein
LEETGSTKLTIRDQKLLFLEATIKYTPLKEMIIKKIINKLNECIATNIIKNGQRETKGTLLKNQLHIQMQPKLFHKFFFFKKEKFKHRSFIAELQAKIIIERPCPDYPLKNCFTCRKGNAPFFFCQIQRKKKG